MVAYPDMGAAASRFPSIDCFFKQVVVVLAERVSPPVLFGVVASNKKRGILSQVYEDSFSVLLNRITSTASGSDEF